MESSGSSGSSGRARAHEYAHMKYKCLLFVSLIMTEPTPPPGATVSKKYWGKHWFHKAFCDVTGCLAFSVFKCLHRCWRGGGPVTVRILWSSHSPPKVWNLLHKHQTRGWSRSLKNGVVLLLGPGGVSSVHSWWWSGSVCLKYGLVYGDSVSCTVL